MARQTFTPYADDAAVQTIGDLAVENGAARIVIHGSLALTRDRAGLTRARALRRTLDAIVRALAAADLPEAADDEGTIPPETVRNPFA
jgi:hypothetical protein